MIIDIVGGSTAIGSTELGDRLVRAVSDAGLIPGPGAVGARLLSTSNADRHAAEGAPRERPSSTLPANGPISWRRILLSRRPPAAASSVSRVENFP